MQRRWLGWVIGALVLVSSIVTWSLTRETLPRVVRFATGMPGGLYHEVASGLKPRFEARTGRSMELISTGGSVENAGLLKRGEADLAILQAGTVDLDGLAVLAPLYEDVVHVVVRRGSGITSIADCRGQPVSLGPEASGMRITAMKVLAHYRVDGNGCFGNDLYFSALGKTSDLKGAIVTTGLLNPDLETLLSGGEFDLLPILDAQAIAIRHPFFRQTTIPRGLYGDPPPVPATDIETLAAMNFLAASTDVSSVLVEAVLTTLYNDYPPFLYPRIMTQRDVLARSDLPLHETARSYHNPFKGIDILANFVESLAGIKEILFTIGAGIYLRPQP